MRELLLGEGEGEGEGNVGACKGRKLVSVHSLGFYEILNVFKDKKG